MKKYIEIVAHKTGEVVQRIDVTKKTEKSVNMIDSAINRNLNHKEYFTREAEYKTEQPTLG